MRDDASELEALMQAAEWEVRIDRLYVVSRPLKQPDRAVKLVGDGAIVLDHDGRAWEPAGGPVYSRVRWLRPANPTEAELLELAPKV